MIIIAIVFIVTVAMLLLLLNTRLAAIVLDQPNHRSLHTKAVPRTGGLAIMAGTLSGWVFIGGTQILILPVVLFVLVSLLDDVRGLPVRWRLLAQFVITAWFIWSLWPGLSWWWMIPVVLAMVWMTNLYNFMDGSDGLAGGMALFGFGSYALAAYLQNDPHLTWMALSVCIASLAFLFFNFHPARIFMGDAGSVPLGFLAGAIGVYGWKLGLWHPWFPILVFSPFILDATITLIKRLVKGEKIWLPHRSHYYQRLVQLGWGHRKTAIAEYVLMATAGLSAVLMLEHGYMAIATIFMAWGLVYGVVMNRIDKKWATLKAG